jgi:hypothetical protein
MHGKKEFASNIPLLKLIKARAEDVYRNRNVDELKAKLAEIKSKSDQFKFNLDSGVGQLKEHCILLRNQVQLQTELLIEKIQRFNESLILEIDNHEKECIRLFNEKMVDYDKESEKLLDEIKKFFNDECDYLAEFKIEDKLITDALALCS